MHRYHRIDWFDPSVTAAAVVEVAAVAVVAVKG